MTAAAAERGTFSSVVRPFESRVVRQEWAAQAVAPMVDALGQGVQQRRALLPAEAYEDSPAAFYVYRMRDGSVDHVGVVADVRLDAFASGGVRGHESVDPHRVDALVRYYADPSRCCTPKDRVRPDEWRAPVVTARSSTSGDWTGSSTPCGG
jgi:hypothetical protein